MLEEGFVDGLQGLLEERVINRLEEVGVQVGRAGASCKLDLHEDQWLLESGKGCKWEKHAKQGLQAAKAGGIRVVRSKSRRSKGCGRAFGLGLGLGVGLGLGFGFGFG